MPDSGLKNLIQYYGEKRGKQIWDKQREHLMEGKWVNASGINPNNPDALWSPAVAKRRKP